MPIDALLMRSKRLTWFCGMVVLKTRDLKNTSKIKACRGAKIKIKKIEFRHFANSSGG